MSIDDQTRQPVTVETDELRARAIKRLKKRHDFYGHLLVYVMVNTFLTVIWAVTNTGGFFWPIFPMVGWGIGVVMNAWDVWRGDELDEDHIAKEMRRLQAHK